MPDCTFPQSPIRIANQGLNARFDIRLNWRSTLFEKRVADDGHLFFTASTPLAGTTTVDGVVYNLKESHFHAPSEHWIDDFAPCSGEMHLVHELAQDPAKKLVIGLLFFNATLGSQLAGDIPIDFPSTFDPYFFMNLAFRESTSQEAVNYDGSLTTPVDALCCDGPVRWFVIIRPIVCDKAFFEQYFPTSKPARPLQPPQPQRNFTWTKNW